MLTFIIIAVCIISAVVTSIIFRKKSPFGPIQEKWLQSLEKHPDRQLKGELGKKITLHEYKACCLGELGLIGGVCKWVNSTLIVDSPKSESTSYLYEVHEKVGLRDANGTGWSKDGEAIESLSHMNDGGKTWPEIAAIVRANPTHYFTKAV